ncbi:MAG: IS481 family transposase [Piscinibacter sp.]|uniref:IS481 family transposase n=1 Tax=Piscinibacter sp. TaxID=1903157 RepID=UPI00258FAE42|nr:IS481 family transposase [Piscinibacter sp.]MCW5663606.1 IS481 family transposase [Piscinibacter sp.]MCW5666383.1 IS481 family transposase [Piscinibacter sp.]
MNSHKHARLTPKGRALLVSRVLELGWTVMAAAEAAGVSRRTTYKWVARFRCEGAAGLADRSSRPANSPGACSQEEVQAFERRRRQRVPLWRIAQEHGRSTATLSRHMARLGLSRLKSLEPVQPVVRYERALPGELLHIDTKRLGRIGVVGHRITGDRTQRTRGLGWEAVHLAIDDHSRVSFASLKVDETSQSCVEFLHQAVAYYAGLGVRIDRVMTDNGAGYKRTFTEVCQALGIRHIKTRPYTPKTNGKVERLVQTSLREWAYARPYDSSEQREAALQPFIHCYNWHRPHSALNHQPPMSRIPAVSNLVKLNT